MGNRKQKGSMVVEFGLILSILVPMLFLVFEGSNMLKTYFTLFEATREGARLVQREGQLADVQTLMEKLTAHLPETSMVTTVNTDQVDKNVTVQVDYEYEPYFVTSSFWEAIFADGAVFHASTTMPIP